MPESSPVLSRKPRSIYHEIIAVLTLGAIIVWCPEGLNGLQQSQIASIDDHADHYGQMAQQIWGWAEVGYQEEHGSALLNEELKAAGFSIESGVAGMPTAFIASHGSGYPVIGILAEFDALPGLSQDAVPERSPIIEGGAGHACGHHLFGVGSVAAAIAVKEWLEETGQDGTIRLYGTPAEEGGAGNPVHSRR